MPFDRECCLVAEIAALTQTSGALGFLGGGRFTVTYQVEHAGVARRLFRMLKEGLHLSPRLHVVEHARLGGRRTCVLTVGAGDAPRLLETLDMMKTEEDGKMTLRRTVPHPQLSKPCCRKAYLRGAFLGSGSMTNPEKGYHLEWNCADEALGESLRKCLDRSGIAWHSQLRRGQQVVYLKSGQSLVDVLAMMGAGHAVMDMENVRITRHIRGDANRAANCDIHNTEKSMSAKTPVAYAAFRVIRPAMIRPIAPDPMITISLPGR